ARHPQLLKTTVVQFGQRFPYEHTDPVTPTQETSVITLAVIASEAKQSRNTGRKASGSLLSPVSRDCFVALRVSRNDNPSPTALFGITAPACRRRSQRPPHPTLRRDQGGPAGREQRGAARTTAAGRGRARRRRTGS